MWLSETHAATCVTSNESLWAFCLCAWCVCLDLSYNFNFRQFNKFAPFLRLATTISRLFVIHPETLWFWRPEILAVPATRLDFGLQRAVLSFTVFGFPSRFLGLFGLNRNGIFRFNMIGPKSLSSGPRQTDRSTLPYLDFWLWNKFDLGLFLIYCSRIITHTHHRWYNGGLQASAAH